MLSGAAADRAALPRWPGTIRAWLDAGAEWPAIEAALDAQAETLAAIVYEPVLQAAGGMLFFSPDLLRRLRAWADAHGVYLIADEIAAGMGRLGAILASHLVDGPGRISTAALPDFAVLSKGLTAGVLPLSAVLTTDAIYDLFDADYADGRAFLHSNTFTGNALAVAVALAVLDVFADDDVLGRVAARGARGCARRCRTIAAERPLSAQCPRVWDGRGRRHPRRATAGRWTPARRTGWHVYREAVRRGALLRPLGDTMYLFPPLTDDRRRDRRDGGDPGRQPGCSFSPVVTPLRDWGQRADPAHGQATAQGLRG